MLGFLFVMYYINKVDTDAIAVTYQVKYLVYIYGFYMILYFAYAITTSYSIHRVINKEQKRS